MSSKCNWKFRLQNVGHVVPFLMWYTFIISSYESLYRDAVDPTIHPCSPQTAQLSGEGGCKCTFIIPDSKVHGANMGPIWGRQDPGGPHVGPMNFAIWDVSQKYTDSFAVLLIVHTIVLSTVKSLI